MKIYLKVSIFVSFLMVTLAFSEPSVYGFNANATDENVIPEVKKQRSLATMQQKLEAQEERIDGLVTIIEGLSASLEDMRASNSNLSTKEDRQNNDKVLKKLAAMIDKIDANYVKKDELDKKYTKKSQVSKKKRVVKKEKLIKKDDLTSKTNATLYSEGVRAYKKQRYSESAKRFTITDEKGYKPAASNYFLGEIAYYTKKYEDAIFFYRKSAGLYDKATYIDTLLLHAAISLDKTGKKSQAKDFYENIIENYPKKKSAKIAKQRLNKL